MSTTTFPGNFIRKEIVEKVDEKYNSERFVFVGETKDVKVLRQCCEVASGSESFDEKISGSHVSVRSKATTSRCLDLTVYVRFEKDKGKDEIRSKSEFEFVVLGDSLYEKDLKRFLSVVSRKHSGTSSCMGKGTYFVSISFFQLSKSSCVKYLYEPFSLK